MLRHRNFWIGFLVAYALAYFLPPTMLFRGRKKA